MARPVPSRHVADARGFVNRERPQAATVEGWAAWPPTLGGAAVTIFHLAGDCTLAVHVHWPERQVLKEAVPVELLEAVQLLPHGDESFGQRDQVGHEHRLQLDVGLKADALQDVSNKVLVRVARQAPLKVVQIEIRVERKRHVKRHSTGRSLEREVPDSPLCPR